MKITEVGDIAVTIVAVLLIISMVHYDGRAKVYIWDCPYQTIIRIRGFMLTLVV